MRLRLFALMVLRGSVYGTVGPFLSILLLRAGLPLALLGPMSGAGALISLVAAPWWGRRGDHLGRRRMFALAMTASAPVLLALTSSSLAVVVAAGLAWAAIAAAFVPLGDSFILDRLDGSRAEFARLRVGASAGFMVTVVAIGLLVSRTDLEWRVPGILGAILVLVTAAAVAIRLGPELRSGRGVAWRPAGTAVTPGLGSPPSPREQIRRHGLFLAGMILVFAGINAPAIFVGPRMADLGGDALAIALGIAAGTPFEVPAFYFLGRALGILGARRAFGIGTVLLAVSGVVAALVPLPALVIAARLFFGVGLAWVTIPSMATIAAAGGPSERASLTGLYSAAAAGGTLVIAVVGLPLVHANEGAGTILAAASLITPLGALLALRGWPVPYRASDEGVGLGEPEVARAVPVAVAGVEAAAAEA